MTRTLFIDGSASDSYELGTIKMRLLATADRTDGLFAMGEFAGGEGPWTVPHVHKKSEESFYVMDGLFTFTIGTDDIEAGPGSFIVVPRGLNHVMRAGPDGGRLLTLWTPGGLEAMFIELSRMPVDSLRDPEVRKALSLRFDSIPS